MIKPYYHPLDCEADYHKSVFNKKDLIDLITKYGRNKYGGKYKRKEFTDKYTKQLRSIWYLIEGALT